MQSKTIIFLVLLSLISLGCKTVSVDQEALKTTNQQVTLSSIGITKDNILQNGFKNIAILNYMEPIKVTISLTSFNQKTYKAFLEASKKQQEQIKVSYSDSIPNKPEFVNLVIADQVSLLNELNAKHNADVKTYLSNKTDANIVTNISMVLNPQDLNDIIQADRVFLVQDGLKNHVLSLQTANQPNKIIKFSEGVVFAFKSSGFCWQEDNRHQLQIVDLRQGYSGCPPKTYLSAKRAKKNINYFKL